VLFVRCFLLSIYRKKLFLNLKSSHLQDGEQLVTFTCSSAVTNVLVLVPPASKTVRSPRPPFVFLRVGEVVMERKGHMVGVVVGWDPELRAPPEWVDRVYSNSEVSSSLSAPQAKSARQTPLFRTCG